MKHILFTNVMLSFSKLFDVFFILKLVIFHLISIIKTNIANEQYRVYRVNRRMNKRPLICDNTHSGLLLLLFGAVITDTRQQNVKLNTLFAVCVHAKVPR